MTLLKVLFYVLAGVFLVFLCITGYKCLKMFTLSAYAMGEDASDEVESVSENDFDIDLIDAGEVKAERLHYDFPVAGSGSIDIQDPDIFIKEVYEEVESTSDDSESSSVDSGESKNTDFSKSSDSAPEEDSDDENSSSDVAVEVPDSTAYLDDLGASIELTDDFIDLCAMVHCEAGEGASVESKAYVGNVAMNRLRDPSKWGYSSVHDVLYADGQFSVVNTKKFGKAKARLLSGDWDSNLKNSVMAAHLAYTGDSTYSISPEVQYFYGDPNKKTWGNHTFCFEFGGNSFFK